MFLPTQSTIKEIGKMILGSNQSYQELLHSFPPRLITSEEQFWATQDVIDALIDKGDLTADEQEYLNLLGTLVYLYEEDSVQIPELRGIPLINALLSERDLQKMFLSVYSLMCLSYHHRK